MMLLNICCAPCGLPILEHLINKEKPVLFFYNPNIYPEEEYIKRLEETKKVALIYDLQLIEGKYDHDGWLAFIRSELPNSPEKYSENGPRCWACFRYRLMHTAVFAKDKGFDAFATTLSVSRFKDVAFINCCAQELAGKYGLKYNTFPLEVEEVHRKGVEISKRHSVYRQKYCGCEFSFPGGRKLA